MVPVSLNIFHNKNLVSGTLRISWPVIARTYLEKKTNTENIIGGDSHA